MTLSPILDAAPVIQAHVAAGLLAILLGPVALYMRPGTKTHKITGYVWVSAMAALALSSFAIHSFAVIGPFSPLHGLALVTLWSLWEGVRHARAGRIAVHRRIYMNLYWFGVIIAGMFNFLPGRAINRALLPDTPDTGFVLIALGVAIALLMVLRPTLRKLWRTSALHG
ncbi:hypothetical protein ROE7235_00355 [Roseibaca ekhonensis]|jgi:uncharacterized membrane protein|uniref:DUF2306 domain-containing protein n=1 Tax=Roseinatronobacter ekhonensis TaxID=254356 RepID=A0A3B0M537_9RHOB|nr:DUF2306 domain-containing protein [Roseibaca ekhonensis]SUZ30630.1 hypothetical protein ROE7235_00355 [Roseibaca ekhonensis]